MNVVDHDELDEAVAIPALEALGDRLEWAAARQMEPQRRPARRPWGAALAPLAAVLGLVLVAGLSLAPAADADTRVILAADRTAAHATGRFRMTTQIGSDGAGSGAAPSTLSVDGEYDHRTGRLRSTVDVGRLLGDTGLVPAGEPVEVIQDGSVLYLRSALFTRLLPQHPQWASLDLDELAESTDALAVAGAGGLDGGDVPADPADLLALLRGMGPDTISVGQDEIGGVVATHYRGTVQLAAATGGVSEADARRLREGFARLGLHADDVPLTMDVWVDDRGEVRRVQTVLDLSAARTEDGSALGAGPATITTDYFDLGVPPTIVVPAHDEVVDITPMVSAALRGPLAAAGGDPTAGDVGTTTPGPSTGPAR